MNDLKAVGDFFDVGNKSEEAEFATIIGHNHYLVLVNVSEEDQPALGGNKRLGIVVIANEDGTAGIANVYKVGPQNMSEGPLEDPADDLPFSDVLAAWISTIEYKLSSLTHELNATIPEGYYEAWIDHLERRDMMIRMRKELGQGADVMNVDDLIGLLGR